MGLYNKNTEGEDVDFQPLYAKISLKPQVIQTQLLLSINKKSHIGC